MYNKQFIGFRVELVVKPDDKGFYAYCPALKGLHTCGATKEEALANARDATIAYIRSSIKHGDPIPVGIGFRETGLRKFSQPKIRKSDSHHIEDLKVACALT